VTHCAALFYGQAKEVFRGIAASKRKSGSVGAR
jgi:hypothetical protein